MRFFQKFKSTVYIWVITYICILTIPTVANIIISTYFTNQMNREAESYNSIYLNKIASDADNIIAENGRIANRLETDIEFRQIAAFGSKLTGEQHNFIYNFIANRARLSETVKVYFKKSGRIITNDAMAQGMVAYDVYSKESGVSYDEWTKIMNGTYDWSFMKIGDNLYEVHTVFKDTDYAANVFMKIEKTILKWSVDSRLFPEGVDITIYDSDNNLIYSTGEVSPLTDDMDFENNFGILSVKSNGERRVVCYQKSYVINWVYFMSLPRENFYKSTRDMLSAEVIILFISLIIGVIGIAVFSMYNYKPLRNLVDSLGGAGNEKEYDFIEHSIHRLNYKYNDMSRRNLVAQLMANSMEIKNDNALLADYGISVMDKAVAVTLSVKSAGDFIEGPMDSAGAETLYGALENVFCEIAADNGYDAYFTNCDGTIGAMLGIGGKLSVSELLIKINEIYEKVLGIKCIISCGETQRGINKISSSYAQSKQVLCMMEFLGITGVGIYSDKADEKKFLLNKLFAAIIDGEKDEWKKRIEEIFTFGIEKPSLSNMRLILYDISKMLLKISRDRNIYSDMEQTKIKNIAEAESLQEFCADMESIVSDIRNSTTDKVPQIDNVTEIKKFIAQNYKNSNLNNRMIADHINLSVNYVSKCFKEQTGDGLLNYITQIRVQAAKELLTSTDKCIQDIAVEVGFYNALALIRAYKKTEGITPTQYRKIKDEWSD